jgi:hypothetical protein
MVNSSQHINPDLSAQSNLFTSQITSPFPRITRSLHNSRTSTISQSSSSHPSKHPQHHPLLLPNPTHTSQIMPKPKILISGAGIAGSVTAYFLALAGFSVTVLERNHSLRTLGQGIDMKGPAISIIQKMKLEKTIREKTTGEKGVAFVDEKNMTFATFDVGDRRNDIGEILRIVVGKRRY